jgi:hypothetical protein
LPLSKILRDFYSIGERIRRRRHDPVLRQKRLEQSKRLKGPYKSAARALKKLRQRGLMVKTAGPLALEFTEQECRPRALSRPR